MQPNPFHPTTATDAASAPPTAPLYPFDHYPAASQSLPQRPSAAMSWLGKLGLLTCLGVAGVVGVVQAESASSAPSAQPPMRMPGGPEASPEWKAMREKMHSTMIKFMEQREQAALDAAGVDATQRGPVLDALKKAREQRFALMQQQRQAMQAQQEQVDQQLAAIMGPDKLKVFQRAMFDSMKSLKKAYAMDGPPSPMMEGMPGMPGMQGGLANPGMKPMRYPASQP